MYAMTCTRPDIAFAVHELTKHMQAPQEHHWAAAKRVLRYLKGTAERGLEFGRPTETSLSGSDVHVTAYADASFGTGGTDGKSTTGWYCMIAGDTISWASKKQSNVALSSCEAELYAETSCVQEVLWTRHILEELELQVRPQSIIYGDNDGTIKLSENGVISERTRHVAVRYHFVKQLIKDDVVKLVWVPTAQQRADILTKALGKSKFAEFCDALLGDCYSGTLTRGR